MKKIARLVLCGLTAGLLLSGCSGGSGSSETAAASSAAEETTEAAVVDKGKVTKLGDYKGLTVTRISTDVTDEEVAQRIQSVMDANPERQEITDREARTGDVVNIDFVGKKDGEAFDGGTSEGYDLELGSHTFIDGFEEGLVGVKAGDKRDLNLTFPEDYGNEDLAGQDVVFEVTVNKVEELKDAVLDDSFVQRVSDFETVAEYQDDTRAILKEEKEKQAEAQLENDALLAAVENSEFDVNEEAVEQQYQNQINYYTMMGQMYGIELEDMVTGLYGTTMEQFESDLRENAELTVKQQLLAEAIAEAEGFKVEEADRKAVADMNGMELDTLVSTYGEEAVDQTAMIYKVVTFIKDNAVVQ